MGEIDTYLPELMLSMTLGGCDAMIRDANEEEKVFRSHKSDTYNCS